jgi:hypothetical protein
MDWATRYGRGSMPPALMSRVHSVNGHRSDDMELEPVWLSDSGLLREAITETGARLLIIDVLMAYLSGDAHKDKTFVESLGRWPRRPTKPIAPSCCYAT